MCVRERACVSYSSTTHEHSFKNTRTDLLAILSALFHVCYTICCCCRVPVSHRKLLTLWQPWYTLVALQGLRFVTATNGAVCVRVCVLCGRAIPNTTRDGSNPHSLRISKHSRSAVAAVSYSSSSSSSSSSSGTTPANLASLIHIGTPVFPLFNLRYPRDFTTSTTSHRGTMQEPCKPI